MRYFGSHQAVPEVVVHNTLTVEVQLQLGMFPGLVGKDSLKALVASVSCRNACVLKIHLGRRRGGGGGGGGVLKYNFVKV